MKYNCKDMQRLLPTPREQQRNAMTESNNHNENQQEERRKLIVFWEGTSNTLVPITTQIGIFSAACCATPIKEAGDVEGTDGPLKISFDGCGVTNGTYGVLFASGLTEQCQVVVDIVRELIHQGKVHVVAVGLSRGGMACMKLARQLAKEFTEEQVIASLLLFDPVPGNAVSTGFPWTTYFDYDLSHCHNLKRVLALYPYEALPDFAMHAPALCRYNLETTLVQEDVTLGCHQGALFRPSIIPRNTHDVASNLSLRRLLDFLQCEGVDVALLSPSIYVPGIQDCLQWMERAKKEKLRKTLTRKTHDAHRTIIRRASNSCQFLNKHHEQLANVMKEGNSSTVVAVYGDRVHASGSYQLDFEEGYSCCPC